MLTASAALRTFLAGNNQTFLAELVTLDLPRFWGEDAARGISPYEGGTRCTWTSAQLDVAGFSASGCPLALGGVSRSAGMEVGELELSLLAGKLAFPNGVRFPLAAAQGAFDGAHVKVERLFMPSWGDTSLGAINWFEGTVSTVEPSSLGVRLMFKSDLEQLNAPLPRRLFQPACPFSVYDAACGATRTPHGATVLAGASSLAISVNPNMTATEWALGTLTFTSGALQGLTRTIQSSSFVSSSDHRITLAVPFPSAPAPGDTCSLLVGCDKSADLATGCARFGAAQLNRFGGYPFVPKPESVR